MGCCGKTATVMISVGDTKSGMIGLHEVFYHIAASGITDENDLQDELITKIRLAGNYIDSSVESLYRIALLKEYRVFTASIEKKKG